MKVLIVGGGGREHALAWKVKQSPLVTELYCAPGNVGTETIATNVVLQNNELTTLAQWAKEQQIDLTIVGPEAPLAAGIVDIFSSHNLKIFGPSARAAELEASKSFSKDVMVSAGVRTARAETFSDFEKAKQYVEKHGAPIVIKADGLAAGKGVFVAQTLDEAIAALESCLLDEGLGTAGASVVVEEFIKGKEASVIAIVDDEVVLPFVLSQDYKRLLDADAGPNTGGMGAISPTQVYPEVKMNELVSTIFLPTIRELKRRGIRYRGFLYAGVMVSDRDSLPYVLEFNCRLGDPETQVLLPRLKSDLVAVLLKAVEEELGTIQLVFDSRAAATVVMASRGYPQKVDDKKVISGLFSEREQQIVFHAGTERCGGQVISKGGRILSVTGLGDSIEEALIHAYSGIKEISFDGAHYRSDIGGGCNQ